jgi:hypothetical protein
MKTYGRAYEFHSDTITAGIKAIELEVINARFAESINRALNGAPKSPKVYRVRSLQRWKNVWSFRLACAPRSAVPRSGGMNRPATIDNIETGQRWAVLPTGHLVEDLCTTR